PPYAYTRARGVITGSGSRHCFCAIRLSGYSKKQVGTGKRVAPAGISGKHEGEQDHIGSRYVRVEWRRCAGSFGDGRSNCRVGPPIFPASRRHRKKRAEAISRDTQISREKQRSWTMRSIAFGYASTRRNRVPWRRLLRRAADRGLALL